MSIKPIFEYPKIGYLVWTKDFPNRNFELRKVRGVNFRIGMGGAWNIEDPTAVRDDVIRLSRQLAALSR